MVSLTPRERESLKGGSMLQKNSARFPETPRNREMSKEGSEMIQYLSEKYRESIHCHRTP
jgi:hypothetical protein